jgi:protease PrsW
VVALSEEGSKYIFLKRYAFRLKSFDEPFDGIVYAVFIGMGFATLENVLYVMNGDVNTAVWRMFTAVPAHATFGVMMGHYSGLAKLRSPQPVFLGMGLLMAVLFHGAYDYFLFIGSRNLIFIFAWVSLLVALWLSFRAIRIHRQYMRDALSQKF